MDIERRNRGADTTAFDGADAAELDQATLLEACRSGKVVKLDDLAGPSVDFFGGVANSCGIPTFAWSSLLIANGDAMKKLTKRRYREPSRLRDLLDTKGFPGKRALVRGPQRVLEMMLLADGVATKDLYEILSTRSGQDRAFELLDALSSEVLWVDGSQEALLALDEGAATMAMIYSGRAFRRLIASRLVPIWDGHIIDFASWAIAADSPRKPDAKRFVKAATSAQSLAAQARIWPYGPMRRSALALARRHELLDTELDEFLPTSDVRFAQGVILDPAFWSKHGTELKERFDAWQSGVPMGIRVPIPVKAPPPPMPPPPSLAPAQASAPAVQ